MHKIIEQIEIEDALKKLKSVSVFVVEGVNIQDLQIPKGIPIENVTVIIYKEPPNDP